MNEAKWHGKLSGHDLGSEAMQRLLHLEVHLTNMQKARKVQDWDCVLKESTLSIEAGADASNQVIRNAYVYICLDDIMNVNY